MTIKDQIIAELRKGDRFAFELKDALNTDYQTLWAALQQLEHEEKVERYFRDTP